MRRAGGIVPARSAAASRGGLPISADGRPASGGGSYVQYVRDGREREPAWAESRLAAFEQVPYQSDCSRGRTVCITDRMALRQDMAMLHNRH
jgi:hypothetical protein